MPVRETISSRSGHASVVNPCRVMVRPEFKPPHPPEIPFDITQIDLPVDRPSGLIEAKNILKDVKGIQMVFFSKQDVVRHKLVQDIIRAYEELDKQKETKKN